MEAKQFKVKNMNIGLLLFSVLDHVDPTLFFIVIFSSGIVSKAVAWVILSLHMN